MEPLRDTLNPLFRQTNNLPSSAQNENVSEPTPPAIQCPNCQDNRFIRLTVGMEDERFGKALPCPYCLDDVDTFETFKPVPGANDALRLARSYATGGLHTPWLILVGMYGTGKTHLARAIVHEHKRRLRPTHMAFVPSLLQELRDSYEAKDHQQVLARFQGDSLVVLDDIGDTGNITPWVKEQILIILNKRYESGQPTVITTNNTMNQIGDLYGGRIASRMWDTRTGISTVAILDCPD